MSRILSSLIICFSFIMCSGKAFSIEYKPQVINQDSLHVQTDYHYLIGELESFGKQKEASIYHFKEASLYSTGSNIEIQLRLAQEYLKHNKHQQAHQLALQLARQVSSTVDKVSVYALLAEIYTSMNLLDEAVHQYTRVLGLDKLHQEARVNRALLKAELTRGKQVPSRSILNQDAGLYAHVGDIYRLFGKWDQASQFYKQALQLDSSNHLAAWKLFQIYSQKKQYKEWLKIMQIHASSDMFITFLQAQAHLKLGETEYFLAKQVDLLKDYTLGGWVQYVKRTQ